MRLTIPGCNTAATQIVLALGDGSNAGLDAMPAAVATHVFYRRADRALRGKDPRLNPLERAFDEGCELIMLFLANDALLLSSKVSQKKSGLGTVLPTGWRSETIQVGERDAIDYGMGDLDAPAQRSQSFLVDLFTGQKFGIIEKIARKPAELPYRSVGAIQAPDDRISAHENQRRAFGRASNRVTCSNFRVAAHARPVSPASRKRGNCFILFGYPPATFWHCEAQIFWRSV